MITVYLKPGDLASWLALAPIKKMVSETGVEVSWKPLVETIGNAVNSNLKPGEDDPLAQYKARRARARSQANKREFQRQCEMLGLSQVPKKQIDPLILSLGMQWVAESSQLAVPSYVESTFNHLYREGGDETSIDETAGLIELSGVASEGFADYVLKASDTLAASQAQLIEAGILSAPAFVVDGEVFLGREHLPLITWMVTGREGPPPV